MPGKAQNSKQTSEAARTRPSPSRQAAEPAVLQRQADPGSFERLIGGAGQASPADVLALQQSVGNRAVTGLLGHAVQCRPAGGRRSADPAAGGDIDPAISSEIERARGGGQPLDAAIATEMGQAFGSDFAGVRVHTGSRADVLNRSLSARAFTIGNDIFLREGAYNPGTSAGRELLAHELTHVVQQGGSAAQVQGKLELGPAGDAYEQEADRLARQVVAGRAGSVGLAPAAPGSTQRQTIQRLFGKKEKQAKPLVDVIAEQLAKEFKGYAGIKGFFTGTRKTHATQKAQGGILTPAQERNIDTLAALDPDRLKAMGFLLPESAEKMAHLYLFTPEKVAALPIKMQMQIATFQSRFEIGRPEPATDEDKEKLKKASRPPVPRNKPWLTGKSDEHSSGESQDEQQKSPKGPSSSDIVLKPDDDGKETADHNIESYRDIVAGYVKKAGTDQGMIKQSSDMLTADYDDVRQGAESYRGVGEQLENTEVMLKLAEKPDFPKKKKAEYEKKKTGLIKAQGSLLEALHEPDFGKAAKDAQGRAEHAQGAVMTATQEKATIEYIYDEVEEKKAAVKKRRSSATKAQKKDTSFNLQTAQQEKAAADEARSLVQQAKMSAGVIGVRRLATDASKSYVQKTLDRFPGAVRKLLGKLTTGILGSVVSIATLGIVNLKGNTGVKGYMGQGLEKKGFPFKPTFLNDIVAQIKQFQATIKARFSGPKAVDVLSALLRGFNEIIVQNVINIAGKVALVSGLLATLMSLLAGITLGATAPIAAVAATISSIATFVALIAAAVKAGVSALRLTLDGLVAMLNSDAKMSNVLTSRAKQSGMESLSDATQLAGSALGPATGNMIKGRGFTNMFDVNDLVTTNVNALSTSTSLGQTIGGTVASTSMTTVAPMVTGPIAQGVVGALDENYSLNSQHRHESRSQPKQPDSAPVRQDIPEWMQAEMEKQNKLRNATFKGRTATAVGQITGVTSQSRQLADKLGDGKSESDKMREQVKDSKAKGNEHIDDESVEMAQAQSGVMGAASSTIHETMDAVTHGKQELKKLADERE